MNVNNKRKPVRILLKGLAWILLSGMLILLVIILAIRIPYVQNKIVQEAVSFLEERIGTKVTLKSIYIAFPKKIVLEELYLEDQHADTLVFLGRISLDTDLMSLLQHRIELSTIQIDESVIHISRAKNDSAFNYDYIIDSFSADKSDSTQTPWTFVPGTLQLNNASVLYQDLLTGNEVDAILGFFDLNVEEFDLVKSTYKISFFELLNSRLSFTQSSDRMDTTTSDQDVLVPLAIDFDMDEAHLNNVSLHYFSILKALKVDIELGDLSVHTDKIDLKNNSIALEKFQMDNSFLSYQIKGNIAGATRPSEKVVIDLDFGWDVKLKELSLSNDSFQYDILNSPLTRKGIDFNHLSILNLTTSVHDIAIGGKSIGAFIENLSFSEHNGFSLQSLTSKFLLTDTNLIIKNLRAETLSSRIDLNTVADFGSLSQGNFIYEQARFRLSTRDSFIALQDILFFAPSMLDSVSIQLPDQMMLSVAADLKGSIDDLEIHQLKLKTLDSTTVVLAGNIKGLSEWREALFHVKLDQLLTTDHDMKLFLPDSLIPSSIILPRWMSLKGTYQGTMNKAEFVADLKSDFGKMDAAIRFDLSSVKSYDVKMNADSFSVGALLAQEKLGALTMNAEIKGSGITRESVDAKVKATVSDLRFNQYDYKDFKIDGSVKNSILNGIASLEDKNLDFLLEGDIDFSEDVPLYKLDFKLKNMDLQNLHLSKRPLKARGEVVVALATRDLKSINGTTEIRNVAIYNGETLYKVDSLLYISIDQERKSTITIRSDILSGDFTGTINLFSLPQMIRQHINQYFSLGDTTLTDFTEPQNFKFDLTLKNTKLLTGIIFPELKPFVPGRIQGEFDSNSKRLLLDIAFAEMQYASAAVDSISLEVHSDSSALYYGFNFKNLTLDTLHIDALEFTGKLTKDTLQSALIVLDSEKESKYLIRAGMEAGKDKGFRFHLIPGQVILNYQKWNVPADNYIEITSRSLLTNHFLLSHQKESIGVVGEKADSSLNFQFSHFKLSNLTRLVSGVVPASGELNGDLKLSWLNNGSFHSILKIAQLQIFERLWGDAVLHIDHTNNLYTVEASVKGDSVDLSANGTYDTSPAQQALEMQLTMSPFKLGLLEPLSFGQLKNLNGLMSGKLNIASSLDVRAIRGELIFNDASFLSTYLNSSFNLQNETISFNEEGIVFSNFKLQDLQKNVAVINGSILTRVYKEFDFDLRVKTKSFQVMNTTKKDHPLYYGLLKLNSNTTITGNSIEPKLDMVVSLTEGSELTYVVPESEKNALEQEGIIQFVDRDGTSDLFLANLQIQDTTNTLFKGMILDANIELNEKSVLNIVIDPSTEDRLSVSGNGSLVLDRDASGNMNLSGRYEIVNGTYDFFFYKLVKRKFAIEKGSSIVWSGDPLNAAMDITANYQVQASPLDLVYNQIDIANRAELSSYGKRLPFIVRLSIKGRLLVPDISFAINMPESNRNVFGGAIYAKLQDINTRESDLNKQVFALLILRRFIADSPFQSQSVSSVGNTARVSVSRLLSEQLNRLSENLKGVQLNFDLRSYENYAGEEVQGQTKVQVGVTKNLFNNRLVVKLSGNLDIEGDAGATGSASDYIGDTALEYKLTSDGRFRVTGFRLSNYDIIDGELIETGTGFIYIKDYNRLRELFRSNDIQK